MSLTEAIFLELVRDRKIQPSLKTYADSLLFYFLGHCSISKSNYDMLEIGVGGSTYVLRDLSHVTGNKLHLVDCDSHEIERTTSGDFFQQEKVVKHVIDSANLKHAKLDNIGYIHIDGSKDFELCNNDIEMSIKLLQPGGLICQDDYGNNKHPAVTIATNYFVNQKKLKFVIIGDSSAWLCKPEDYDHWIEILKNHKESILLSQFVNLNSAEESVGVPKSEDYFYLRDGVTNVVLDLYNQEKNDLFYLLKLFTCNNINYLQMPYKQQSKVGNRIVNLKGKLEDEYHTYYIKTRWDIIRGPDWPNELLSLKDLHSLESWIKEEIENVHNIDLYKVVKKD